MKSYHIFLVLILASVSMLAQTPTISSLVVTGSTIKWYDSPTGGTQYTSPATTNLVNGQIYYASQTVNGVESTTRVAITATLVTVAAPTAGTHVAAQIQIEWKWNTVSGATGYKWNTENVYSGATDLGNVLTKTETGLACNTDETSYLWAYNGSCVSAVATITQTTSACAAASTTFDYTGSVQSFTVPVGVNSITFEAWGAQGGTNANDFASCGDIGGTGGYATGILAVTPGETIWIYVGGKGVAGATGGFNGGGASGEASTCGSGGGASDIRKGGTTLNDRVIVAGGGGGAEYSACNGTGGTGGGLNGNDGSEGGSTYNGKGATQIAGGAAGAYRADYPGYAGTWGVGGTSGSIHSGGGGGGYYGGGGSSADGHGGGGSSYIGGVSGGSTTAGLRSGNGQIKITY